MLPERKIKEAGIYAVRFRPKAEEGEGFAEWEEEELLEFSFDMGFPETALIARRFGFTATLAEGSDFEIVEFLKVGDLTDLSALTKNVSRITLFCEHCLSNHSFTPHQYERLVYAMAAHSADRYLEPSTEYRPKKTDERERLSFDCLCQYADGEYLDQELYGEWVNMLTEARINNEPNPVERGLRFRGLQYQYAGRLGISAQRYAEARDALAEAAKKYPIIAEFPALAPLLAEEVIVPIGRTEESATALVEFEEALRFSATGKIPTLGEVLAKREEEGRARFAEPLRPCDTCLWWYCRSGDPVDLARIKPASKYYRENWEDRERFLCEECYAEEVAEDEREKAAGFVFDPNGAKNALSPTDSDALRLAEFQFVEASKIAAEERDLDL
jgi:hypothetical protein